MSRANDSERPPPRELTDAEIRVVSGGTSAGIITKASGGLATADATRSIKDDLARDGVPRL